MRAQGALVVSPQEVVGVAYRAWSLLGVEEVEMGVGDQGAEEAMVEELAHPQELTGYPADHSRALTPQISTSSTTEPSGGE